MLSISNLCLFQLVVISDPHIKVDPDWPLYCEARDGDHFVRVKDGGVYIGSCWPGEVWAASSYKCSYTTTFFYRHSANCSFKQLNKKK